MEITEDEEDEGFEYNEIKDSDEEDKDSDDDDLNNFETLKQKTMLKVQSRGGKSNPHFNLQAVTP